MIPLISPSSQFSVNRSRRVSRTTMSGILKKDWFFPFYLHLFSSLCTLFLVNPPGWCAEQTWTGSGLHSLSLHRSTVNLSVAAKTVRYLIFVVFIVDRLTPLLSFLSLLSDKMNPFVFVDGVLLLYTTFDMNNQSFRWSFLTGLCRRYLGVSGISDLSFSEHLGWFP